MVDMTIIDLRQDDIARCGLGRLPRLPGPTALRMVAVAAVAVGVVIALVVSRAGVQQVLTSTAARPSSSGERWPSMSGQAATAPVPRIDQRIELSRRIGTAAVVVESRALILDAEQRNGTVGTVAPSAADDPSAVRPLARPLVVLYGDSLAWEAQHSFVQAFTDQPGVEVVVRTYGGTAICDWLETMSTDAATLAPGAVVIEFSGNALTPCMQDDAGQGLTGDEYFGRYASDAEQAITIFADSDAQVIFAGAPISLADEQNGEDAEARLNPMYRELGERSPDVRYVDAGAAVLDAGSWTKTLPCIPGEPCTDQQVTVVRASDGVHFCPAGEEAVRGVTGECPVWSSGAFRYGQALAQPVLDSLAVARTS